MSGTITLVTERRSRPPVGIQDIARAAGVSVTTVSHVFSGKRPVAGSTRKRVTELSRQLGYRPNRAARGLRSGHTMTLGLRFPFDPGSVLLNPYFPPLVEGLSAAASEAGYGFLLIPILADGEAGSLRGLVTSERLDGVVIVDPRVNDPLIRLIRKRRIPAVTTGRYPGPDPLPWVDNDHPAGIVELFRHLDRQGFRRPGLISASGGFSYVKDTEETCLEEGRLRGVKVPIVRVRDLSAEEGQAGAILLLDRRNPPDVIITVADRQALGVLRAVEELGIRVPQELGVVGEGDTVLARHSRPTLTTIAVRPRRLGALAVHRMLHILTGRDEGKNILLPAEIVPRRSTRRELTSRGSSPRGRRS